MNKPDKYLSQRAQITSIFHENRGIYGYRRIYLALKRKGIMLSEKIIRRIMKKKNWWFCARRNENIVRIWGNHTRSREHHFTRFPCKSAV
ncbi:IS3 family transposase [Butyricicoccus porcorum]